MAESCAFGIDLGGTAVKIGCFDLKGNLLDKWSIPTRTEDKGEKILPDIAASVHEYMQKNGLTAENTAGAGIDVPGAVREEGIVNKCANLGWGVKNVKEELSALLDGIPVCVANDANAAALGEMQKAGDFRNIVMVTLGTGVGGGVIIDGKIVSGAFGAAGEIGHIPVNPQETERCGCGKKGCLEQYASATGIVRVTRKKLDSGDRETVLRDGTDISARKIFDAAKAGDGFAMEVIEEVCEILGRALASIACVVDPEAFVIGGGVSAAGSILIDTIQKYYRENAFHASKDTVFKLAELGNDAGMYGAVRMILSGLDS